MHEFQREHLKTLAMIKYLQNMTGKDWRGVGQLASSCNAFAMVAARYALSLLFLVVPVITHHTVNVPCITICCPLTTWQDASSTVCYAYRGTTAESSTSQCSR